MGATHWICQSATIKQKNVFTLMSSLWFLRSRPRCWCSVINYALGISAPALIFQRWWTIYFYEKGKACVLPALWITFQNAFVCSCFSLCFQLPRINGGTERLQVSCWLCLRPTPARSRSNFVLSALSRGVIWCNCSQFFYPLPTTGAAFRDFLEVQRVNLCRQLNYAKDKKS